MGIAEGFRTGLAIRDRWDEQEDRAREEAYRAATSNYAQELARYDRSMDDATYNSWNANIVEMLKSASLREEDAKEAAMHLRDIRNDRRQQALGNAARMWDMGLKDEFVDYMGSKMSIFAPGSQVVLKRIGNNAIATEEIGPDGRPISARMIPDKDVPRLLQSLRHSYEGGAEQEYTHRRAQEMHGATMGLREQQTKTSAASELSARASAARNRQGAGLDLQENERKKLRHANSVVEALRKGRKASRTEVRDAANFMHKTITDLQDRADSIENTIGGDAAKLAETLADYEAMAETDSGFADKLKAIEQRLGEARYRQVQDLAHYRNRIADLQARHEFLVNQATNVAPMPQAISTLTDQSGGQSTGPKVGDVVGGYEFMGGNPNDKTRWRKVQ